MTNKIENQDILTLSEVAEYLKIAEKTVMRMAQRGEIPCAKIASQWRFIKPMIDNWLITKMNRPPGNDFEKLVESPETNLVPVARLLHESFIIMDVSPGTKEQVLKQLVAPLTCNNLINNPEEYLNRLLEREQMLSTAIGNGIAIPHIRYPRDNPRGVTVVIIGICKSGTDFDALDKGKTYLFLLLCTDSEILHLRILSKLSKLLTEDGLLQILINAESAHNIIEVISKKEQDLMLSY